MMQKKTLLNAINSYPEHAKQALENVYRGKVFAVGRTYNARVDGFFKTNRGAEGYIKKHSTSYYDEMLFKMVSCADGMYVEEINPSDILDPQTSKQIWYAWMRECLGGYSYMYDSILNSAKRMNVSDEVMEYVQASVKQMKEENCLSVLESEMVDIVETEVVEEAVEENNQQVQSNEDIYYRLNEQMNGIEIIFSEKPEQAVIANLKNNGFRWSKRGFWYAKQSTERIEFTKSLCGEVEEIASVSPASASYPEINIDDIDTYVVDEKIQQAEHNANWIFRKNEIDRTKEIQDHFAEYTEQVKQVLAETDNERISYYLKSALQKYKKKYFECYLAQLRHKGSNPNWAVTGRGGLNTGRYNKAVERYDRLIQESVELSEKMKKIIDKARREIRQEKENQIRSVMSQTNIDIDFSVETKTITFSGLTEKLRTYSYGGYMIAKTWGCYRIFKDGKLIRSMKTTDKLEDAKRYVVMLVQDKLSA